MNKMLIFGIMATLLVVGCTAPLEEAYEQPTEGGVVQEAEKLPEGLDEELIIVKGNEELSVATIRAVKEGNRWYFPLDEYEDEFLGVGLHSDSFIKLDSGCMEPLEEGEAIWLTPMIKEDKGVLFNAIYSRDVKDCSAEKVMIIGKEYEVTTLKDGSAFGNDDKWKVALDYDGSCLKRVVVYLDGYFYDLTEDDHMALFRNDNTALIRFENLEDEPKIEVVVAKPAKQALGMQGREAGLNEEWVRTYKVQEVLGNSYNETETRDASGLHIEFEPSVPMFDCYGTQRNEFDCLTENHGLKIMIDGSEWKIARLRYPGKSIEVEKYYWKKEGTYRGEKNISATQQEVLIGRGDEGLYEACTNISIGNKTYQFNDIGWDYLFIAEAGDDCDCYADYSYVSKDAVELNEEENLKLINGKWVRSSAFCGEKGWGTCASTWADIDVFDELINIKDNGYNVALEWEDEGSWNPALKSIFIPQSSPIFENLSAQ